MAGIATAMPQVRLVRRVITRAPGLGGEEYDAMTPEAFEIARSNGVFALCWGAHGLQYGIPAHALRDVQAGRDVVANLSRGALSEAARVFPALSVLNITASPDTLAHRLTLRGRETRAEISDRLARTASALPSGLDVTDIGNDGPLADTVAQAVAALKRVGA